MFARLLRSPDARIVLLLLLLPAALLGDSLFGGHRFLPFDTAEFPPLSCQLAPEELAVLRTNADYDASEPPIWFVPELELARESLAAGHYPHWNPYVRGGAPLTANGLLGLLEPLHWPALLFADATTGLLYLTYVLYALAGVLMFGLLRDLGCVPLAALVGAGAFAWSGTLVANGHWYMRMEPLALLPGMLWALLRLERARGRRRGLPAVLFAVPTAMAWSACFPPFTIPCSLFCALFALVLLVRTARRDGAHAALAFACWAAAAAALGLSLAGAQVLQQVLFFPVSNRPIAPTLASASRFAFDPMGLLGYVLPEAFSHPGDRLLPAGRSALAWLLYSNTEWGTGALLRPDRNYNFSEYSVWPGTLPLLLAALGIGGRGPRWRLLTAAALLATLLLAIGFGPFRYAFALPGIQAVPPYRFAGPACAFVALLAGLGCQRLLRDGGGTAARVVALAAALGSALCWATASRLAGEGAEADARWLQAITAHYRPLAREFDANLAPEMVTDQLVRRALFTGSDADGRPLDQIERSRRRLQDDLDRTGMALGLGAAFLLLASLRGRRPLPVWLALPALLLGGAELWAHAQPLNAGRPAPSRTDSKVHEFLRQQRLASAEQGGFLVARANPGGGDAMHLPPGTLAREHIRDLHFYSYVDAHSTEPLRALYGEGFLLRDYLPQALPDDARLQLPWWDAIGLRYLFSTAPLHFGGAQVGPEVHGNGQSLYVHERATALPRAWVVPRLHTVDDDAAMVQAAIAADFAPREHALVTAADAQLLPTLPAAPLAAARTVRFAYEDGKRVTLQVGAGPAGYLVLADTHLPGWTARIDGTPVPIARGNVCQRVVALPDGACTVAFRYRTPGLVGGLMISATAGLLCVLLVVASIRARRALAANAP